MARPTATLGFPYRGIGVREQIFGHVLQSVANMYPFEEVIIKDSGHPTFNRAASRNEIADHCIHSEAQVMVICDADSIPDQDILIEAIEEAESSSNLHVPFDMVKVLPFNRFNRSPHKYRNIQPINEYGPSCGGIYVCRPNLWLTLGGMDERIEGWGYEDQIFLASVLTYGAGPVYHVGDLWNIDHPRGVSPEHVEPNRALVDRYHAAQGNIDAFKRVAAGSNRFRPD